MEKPPQDRLLSFETRVLLMLGLGIFTLGLVLCLPFWPQNPCYHQFADDRNLLGVPNLLNVLSNVPFVVIGSLGWLSVCEKGDRTPKTQGSCPLFRTQPGGPFLSPAER